MATRTLSRLPPAVLEIIDERVRRGDLESREAFVEAAVRRYASEVILEELQRRHGKPGSLTSKEERRIVRLVRSLRK